MKTKQKVFMLLDRSGSMCSMWDETLSGVNSYVKKLSSDAMGAEIMLASFDSEEYEVHRNCKLSDWKPLNKDEVYPRSWTPLLDSAGRMIHNMIDSQVDRAILVVITDGYENKSSKFTASEIKNMTSHIQNVKKYEVVFLGANFDGIADVAKQNFGIDNNSKYMHASVAGFGLAMNATATGSANYFNTGDLVGAFYNEIDKKNAAQK